MPEHLLIVDDEPDLELMITQRLRKEVRAGKYMLHFAQNGQEALEKLKATPDISVVITDISMPIMNGLELLKRINDAHNPALKVVVASAFGDMDNIRFAMNHGAFDFLTKPIDFNELEKVVEKTLELIKTIKQGLQAKQQLDSYDRELLTAKEVQLSMLPKKFPPFANIKQFDVFGKMNAAELVGGDFFDFFLINEEKIGFVIGDVSGKGIPASIFMAVSSSTIRSFGMADIPTNECLKKSNEFLYRISSDSMFVNVFYGVLNFKTGELRYTNAGHNYPYIITADKNNKIVELNSSSNVMLGAFEDAVFNENVMQLEPETMIICYTDGVTEAMNKDKQLLGNEALQQFLNYTSNKDNPKNVTESIFDLVHQHASGCEQSDDITVLTLAYHG
jgi:sigma-B regulation protein RsbU (phosphoserine phosphatase)